MWGFIGQFLYLLSYPGLLLLIKGTKRAYVIVVFENKVLVTKNWLGFRRKWRLPGGGAKNNESYMQAAIREVKEEVGIDLNGYVVKPIDEPIRHKKGFYFQTFITELERYPEIVTEFPEIWKAEFIDIDKLSNDEISQQVKHALSKLGKNT
jgi:8-oxo-dGTP pyrophosphatase MutT (NUDIX family)